MKYTQVTTFITALTLSMFISNKHTSGETEQRFAVRQQDVGLADPVMAVAGNWTALPSGRATKARAYYSVEVTVPTEGGPPATIGFGLLDEPGKREPVIASLCDGCFDTARSAPAPSGWLPYGNHGTLGGTTRFMLNFDARNARWGWYLNGQAVRWVQSGLFGPGLRISVGVRLGAADERPHEMWHNDIRLRRDVLGGQIFQPNDSLWPQTPIDGATISYEPGGTVIVHGIEAPVSQPSTVLPRGSVRGGRGGPIVAGAEANQVYAARGTAIELVDSQQGHLTTLVHLTSTITAMTPFSGGVLVGTHTGSLIRLSRDVTDTGERVDLGAPISALAVDANDVLIGTVTGYVFRLVLSPKWTVLASSHVNGKVRFIIRQGGMWILGVEVVGAGDVAGRVHELRLDDARQLAILDGVDLPSPPVGILTPGSGRLVMALQSGELRRLTSSSGTLADDGRVLIVPEAITSITGGSIRAYALSQGGNAWAIALEPTGQAHILAQQAIGMPGGEIELLDGWLFATSESGRIAAFTTANGVAATAAVDSVDIGSVTSLVSTSNGLGVLAGYSMLQWLSDRDVGSSAVSASPLPRRGVALRPWSNGIAVVNGDAGVDLYQGSFTAPVSHLETGGVCRDLVSDRELAYIACGTNGVYVADLADPGKPVNAVVLATESPALAVAVSGPKLLVGRQGGDILVFDRSDPRTPRPIGQIAATPNVSRIVVQEGRALGLSRTGTGYLLDISDASENAIPELMGTLRFSRYGFDLNTDDEGLLVASADDGLERATWPNGRISDMASAIYGPVTAVSGSYRDPLAGSGPAGLVWWPTVAPIPTEAPAATATITPVHTAFLPNLETEH